MQWLVRSGWQQSSSSSAAAAEQQQHGRWQQRTGIGEAHANMSTLTHRGLRLGMQTREGKCLCRGMFQSTGARVC